MRLEAAYTLLCVLLYPRRWSEWKEDIIFCYRTSIYARCWSIGRGISGISHSSAVPT